MTREEQNERHRSEGGGRTGKGSPVRESRGGPGRGPQGSSGLGVLPGQWGTRGVGSAPRTVRTVQVLGGPSVNTRKPDISHGEPNLATPSIPRSLGSDLGALTRAGQGHLLGQPRDAHSREDLHDPLRPSLDI